MVVRATPSGQECIRALLALGFRVKSTAKGVTYLKREDRIVIVPQLDELTPGMFFAILRSAGVTVEEIKTFLPTRSGTYARFTFDDRKRRPER